MFLYSTIPLLLQQTFIIHINVAHNVLVSLLYLYIAVDDYCTPWNIMSQGVLYCLLRITMQFTFNRKVTRFLGRFDFLISNHYYALLKTVCFLAYSSMSLTDSEGE